MMDLSTINYRRTGRTTRMLEEVCRVLDRGGHVAVIMATALERDSFNDRFLTTLQGKEALCVNTAKKWYYKFPKVAGLWTASLRIMSARDNIEDQLRGISTIQRFVDHRVWEAAMIELRSKYGPYREW